MCAVHDGRCSPRVMCSCGEWQPDSRQKSRNHLLQFRTSERRAQINCFGSGLQSAERKSFGSVRDFRAQSTNHFIFDKFSLSTNLETLFLWAYCCILIFL